MRLRRVLPGLALLALPMPASADSITVLAFARSVYADASVGSTVPIGAPVQNQPVLTTSMEVKTAEGEALSSAFLTSFADAATGQFGARGGTSLTHSSPTVFSGGYAQTDYGVSFELSEALPFTFTAAFATSGGGGNSRSSWGAELFHYPSDIATSAFAFIGGDTRQVSTGGLLLPGRYTLFVNSASSSFAIGDRNTSADFTFNLQFASPGVEPIPEPASILLLTTGALGILARRRMRRHR
jgi:hypothetical protein